jgi:hypothetical protein
MKATNCARRYPKVLAHSLLTDFDVEVPTSVRLESAQESYPSDKVSMEEWINEGGVGRLSYAVLAAQSCDEDIIEMQKGERQRIVEACSD